MLYLTAFQHTPDWDFSGKTDRPWSIETGHIDAAPL
jgi:hypothetical protein